jgi:hypothetical protein
MINKTHVNHQPIKPMQLVSYSLATWLSFLVPKIVEVNLPNIVHSFFVSLHGITSKLIMQNVKIMDILENCKQINKCHD